MSAQKPKKMIQAKVGKDSTFPAVIWNIADLFTDHPIKWRQLDDRPVKAPISVKLV